MSGLNIRCYKQTALDQIHDIILQHKNHYNALPYRVTLSGDWKESMQGATEITVESQKVVIGYRSNQDRYTVTCDTVKGGNRRPKQAQA